MPPKTLKPAPVLAMAMAMAMAMATHSMPPLTLLSVPPSGELAMLPCVQPSPPPKHTNLPSAEAYTLR